jgi:hypothetical protein
MSGVGRVPAMDCRIFSELPQFSESKYTQLVILMDRWLGFLFVLLLSANARQKL